MDYKEKLGAMIDAVIAGTDPAAARAAFHDYSTATMKDMLKAASAEVPPVEVVASEVTA